MVKILNTPEEDSTQELKGIWEKGILVWKIVEKNKEEVQGVIDLWGEWKVEKSPEAPRKIRIYLVRHYPYVENEDYLAYHPLREKKNNKEEMSDQEEEDLKNLSKKVEVFSDFKMIPTRLQRSLTQIFTHPQKTLVVCDHEWVEFWEKHRETRMVTTEKSLKMQFPWVHSLRKSLPKSNKDEELIDNQLVLGQALSDTLSQIATTLPSDIDTIVIVSNRSYANAFNFANKQISISMKDAVYQLENVGVISYEGKYIYSDKLKKKIFKTDPISIEQAEQKVLAFKKTREIQDRSLEKILYQDQAWPNLERRVYFMEEEKMEQSERFSEQGERKEKKYSKRYISIDQLFDTNLLTQEGRNSGKFVLPAHVGNGKSFLISEVVKRLVWDVNRQIRFFEGRDFSQKNYSREKIENLFKQAEETQTIICIDAIDEINDERNKKVVKELLRAFKGQCFVTARKTEYADENPGFITLHLDPMDMEEFLQSRFWDDEKKMKTVQKKLTFMNLYGEIQWNPLLLSFVCILANLDEKTKKKYEKLWIKSLEDIWNKTDLYENISRLIISEHFESKWNSSSKEELNLAMENLWKNAYSLFKWDSLDISDEYLQKLSVLFKRSDTWSYQFIHESFYEFFLARYLTGQSNGNEEIYKMRDDNDDNWNEWRGFKPVILFYGEGLAKLEKWNELEALLSWLLKNDDIFGEGFFMGLEILYRIEQDGELNNGLLKIKGKYLEQIKKWDKKKSLSKLMLFQEFQKRINFWENEYIDVFFNKINWFGHRSLDGSVDYRDIIKLWSANAINSIITFAEIIEKFYYDDDESYYNGYCCESTMLNLYNTFLESWNEKAIDFAIKWIQTLVEQEKISEFLYTLVPLIKSWNEKALKFVESLSMNWMSKGYDYYVSHIHIELVKIWKKEYIDWAIGYCDNLLTKNETHISELIMEIWNKINKEFVFKCADKLFEVENFKEVLDIYIVLVESWEEKSINYAINWYKKLINKNKFNLAWFLLCELIKIENEGAINWAFDFIDILLEDKEFHIAWKIYAQLIKIKNEKAINWAFEFIKKIIWEKSEKISENDRFNNHEKYHATMLIYVELIKIWYKEAIDWALEFAIKLEKNWWNARYIYLELIKIWNDDAVNEILNSAKWYVENIEADRSHKAEKICEQIIKSWNEKAIDWLFELMDTFSKKRDFYEAGIISEVLVDFLDIESINRSSTLVNRSSTLAKKCWRKWYVGDYMIYSKKFKKLNKKLYLIP